MFDIALGIWYGDAASLCVFAETCGNALALEHNGDLYACDHYVEPKHLLGNISQNNLRDLAFLPQQQQFGQAKRDTLPQQCRNCPVRFACNGGCPKDRFITSQRWRTGLELFVRRVFRHVSTFGWADEADGGVVACGALTGRDDGRKRVAGTRSKGQGARGKGQGARGKGQGARGKGQGARCKGQGARGKGQGASADLDTQKA